MTIGRIGQLKTHDSDSHEIQVYNKKINELTDAVNNLEATVYGGDDDCDDICPDCWAETEPFIASLPDLTDEQLLALQERVQDILDEREEGYDGCCHCNCDCHDLPDDDDEDVTEEVQKLVDDMRGKNEPRGSHKLPSGETYFVTPDDGLLFDLVKECINHPELRFWQALRNLSGYNFIFGSTAKSFDDYSQLEDTFNLKTKEPQKGER